MYQPPVQPYGDAAYYQRQLDQYRAQMQQPMYPMQQNQMQPQFNQMQSVQQPQQPAAQGLKGWVVQSEDDARKAVIDFDGSVYLFVNAATGQIYTKQISTEDFSTIFKAYQPIEQPKPIAPSADLSEYVKREEFSAISDKLVNLEQNIEKLFDGLKETTTTTRKKEADAK